MTKENMEEQLATAVGMKDHKKIDVENYSAAELLYLSTSILKEVERRDMLRTSGIKMADAETSRLSHDIEMNFEGTNTEKIKLFDTYKQALVDRRHIKQEANIIRRMAYAVNVKQSKTQSLDYIAELLNEHDRREDPNTSDWGKVNECIPTYRQGEFKRLLTKVVTY